MEILKWQNQPPFRSKATVNRKRKLSDLQDKMSITSKKVDETKKSIILALEGREDTEERSVRLKKLKQMKEKKRELESSLQNYRDCDPQVLEKLRREIVLSKDATNRWTDNVYSLHSWIGKMFPSIAINDLNQQFGIPEDLDYVDN